MYTHMYKQSDLWGIGMSEEEHWKFANIESITKKVFVSKRWRI